MIIFELVPAVVVVAVGIWAVIRAVDWLIESLPSSVLPWSILALVVIALVVFGAAAVARVGRLP